MEIMIDIETLATSPDAAVLSIGACRFDRGTGAVSNPFLVSVPRSYYEDGMQTEFAVDPETCAWWDKQGDEAKKALGINTVATPYLAMDKLLEWFADNEFERTFKFGRDAVWANPPQFDLTILRHLAKRTYGKEDVPWSHRQERDLRTIRALDQERTGRKYIDNLPGADELIAHRADHDAIKQAYELMERLRPC
jgi:exodeoxyribonuclease VIII